MTYRDALMWGQEILQKAGVLEAGNDAWLLLAHVCKIDRTFYYMHMSEGMPQEEETEYASLIKKRAERVPLQYITGEQAFMGLSFAVNSHVLIPRQDTECLVEEALKYVREGMRLLDLCTGTGCVLISILKHGKGLRGCGGDVSRQAVLVAKENARRHGVDAEFIRSNLFEKIEGVYDVITANPPYIPTAEIPALMPEVSQFEPQLALDGKEDGLFFYREIAAKSRDYLNPGGMVLLEIGCGQGKAVAKLLEEAGFCQVQVVKDLANHDRVVCGKWAGI